MTTATIRPKSPAEAERLLLAGVLPESLTLVGFERDILVAGSSIFGEQDRSDAILRLAENPLLLRSGVRLAPRDEETGERPILFDPRQVRRDTASQTLSKPQESRLERYTLLAFALGEMREPRSGLPRLQFAPEIQGNVLLLPIGLPFYTTTVVADRVLRRKSRLGKPGRKRAIPEGALVRPWDLPWLYLLRCYLPSRLKLERNPRKPRDDARDVGAAYQPRGIGDVHDWLARFAHSRGYKIDDLVRPIPRGRLSPTEAQRRRHLAAAVRESVRVGTPQQVIADALGTNRKQIQRLLSISKEEPMTQTQAVALSAKLDKVDKKLDLLGAQVAEALLRFAPDDAGVAEAVDKFVEEALRDS